MGKSTIDHHFQSLFVTLPGRVFPLKPTDQPDRIEPSKTVRAAEILVMHPVGPDEKISHTHTPYSMYIYIYVYTNNKKNNDNNNMYYKIIFIYYVLFI